MRRVLLLFLLVGLVLPGSSSASATGSVAVTGISAEPYLVTASFSATVTQTCPPLNEWGYSYCGWFAKITTVPAGQACSDFGIHVWVGPLEDGGGTRTYAGTYSAVPGPDQIACLYIYDGSDGMYTLVAQSAPYHLGSNTPPTTPPPIVPAPTVDPTAGLIPDLIPSWVAARRRAESFFISTASIPTDVDRDRFVAIARVAGARWRLRDYGTVRRGLRLGNWENELGFVWNLPRRTLGSQTDMVLVRYRPGRRVCSNSSCWWRKRKVISRELVDRDVAINATLALAQGPERPAAGEIDLETVVLHELGHLAGNRHAGVCRNTPMVVAMTTGEWWHSPTDYNWIGCGQATAARSRLRARLEHTHEQVLLPAGRSGDQTLRAHRDAQAGVTTGS